MSIIYFLHLQLYFFPNSYFSTSDLEIEDKTNSKSSRTLAQAPVSSSLRSTGATSLQELSEDNHYFGDIQGQGLRNSKEQNLESITISGNSEYTINDEEPSKSKKIKPTGAEGESSLSDENVIPRLSSTNNVPRFGAAKTSIPYSDREASEGHENTSKSAKRFASGIPRLSVGTTATIPRISSLKRPTLALSKKTNQDKKGSIALSESGLRDALYDFHPQPQS